MGASVKIMLSHDYCHFEISKSSDQNLTDQEIDAMRKDVQRLADKAVEQYKKAKAAASESIRRNMEYVDFKCQVERILLKSEGQRTIDEVALVKAFEDRNWKEFIENRYNYED